MAAGAVAGQLIVPRLNYAVQNNFGGLGLGSHTDGETVDAITVDGLELSRCQLIKIDVEGMEEQVLRGPNRRSLVAARFCMSSRTGKTKADCRFSATSIPGLCDVLASAVDVQSEQPSKCVTENLFPGIVSLNVLCVSRSMNQRIEDLLLVVFSRECSRPAGTEWPRSDFRSTQIVTENL